MKKSSMFEKYPDVVEVDDLRKMLGGISRRLAYRLLAEQEIRCIKVSLFAESVPRNSPKRAIPHYLSYQQTHSSLSAAIRSGSLRTEWEKDPELHHKDERHSSLCCQF